MVRLTSLPGNGAEKVAGMPASLSIRNMNMVTYIPCKNAKLSPNKREFQGILEG
jgi:hypothetical protein